MDIRKINLESRYRDVDTYCICVDNSLGILISNGNYTRNTLSEEGNSIKGVDFEGGPMIYVGDVFADTNKKIKSIRPGYYIELE